MSDLIRSRGLYMQVADQMTDAITAGEYAPGDALPTESQMMERYKISRPTVRSAMAELRARGLAESRHGMGTFVRRVALAEAVIDRSITRRGKRHGLGWEGMEAEFPSVTRGHATGPPAILLGLDEDAVFVAERVLTDPDTGVRACHRTTLPFTTAEQCPSVAKSPDTDPAAIYDALTAAGHSLTWTDHITARAPRPDERQALQMEISSPILVTYRVTADADGRPLLLEELAISADRGRLAYRVTPEKAPARRSRSV